MLHATWLAGQSGHTAEHNEISLRLRDVSDYGAKGGGIDDTAAIQSAIDDCPEGGTVVFPFKHYKFTRLTINKALTLRGAGWYQSSYALYGGNWVNRIGGTVLESTATTGAAISYTGASVRRVNVHDLAVLGSGAGSSAGIAIENTSVLSNWSNILVANFATGISWIGVEDAIASNVIVDACDVGWFFGQYTNQNTLLQIHITHCATYGLKFSNAVLNAFLGGVIQGNTGTCVLLEESDGTKLDSIYFENKDADCAVDISRTVSASADRCGLVNCHFGTLGDKVIVRGNQNYILFPQMSSATLEITGYDNLFMGVWNGTVTDAGTNNLFYNLSDANTKMIVSEYADNAAAIASGLKAGQTYRTGDVLKVVH